MLLSQFDCFAILEFDSYCSLMLLIIGSYYKRHSISDVISTFTQVFCFFLKKNLIVCTYVYVFFRCVRARPRMFGARQPFRHVISDAPASLL